MSSVRRSLGLHRVNSGGWRPLLEVMSCGHFLPVPDQGPRDRSCHKCRIGAPADLSAEQLAALEASA